MFNRVWLFCSAVLLGYGCMSVAGAAQNQDTPIEAIAGSCAKDMDSCVLLVVAETATFVDACGKAYPDSRGDLNKALENWSVLKLKIPRLKEVALDPASNMRKQLQSRIDPYLKQISADERGIECSARLEMLSSPEPVLKGDAAHLPDDVLRRYE